MVLKSIKSERRGREILSLSNAVPKLVYWVTHNPYSQLLGIISGIGGFVFLIISAIQLNEEIEARKIEREIQAEERIVRQEERIERAWNTLWRPATYDSGKARALEFLLQSNKRVVNLELTCEKIGEFKDGECVKPAIFNDFSIPEGTTFNANFHGNVINRLNIKNNRVNLQLSEVSARDWDIENTTLRSRRGETAGFSCENCSFSEGRIDQSIIMSSTGAINGSSVYYSLPDLEEWDARNWEELYPPELAPDNQKITVKYYPFRTQLENLPWFFTQTDRDTLRCPVGLAYRQLRYCLPADGNDVVCLEPEEAFQRPEFLAAITAHFQDRNGDAPLRQCEFIRELQDQI